MVWALLREIGRAGLRERVCRHNTMARLVAERARAHPRLEVVQEPTLSTCCFRYVGPASGDLDDRDALNHLNQRIHRELVRAGRNMPSTAAIGGVIAIRPCVGARTPVGHAHALVDQVIEIGDRLVAERNDPPPPAAAHRDPGSTTSRTLQRGRRASGHPSG